MKKKKRKYITVGPSGAEPTEEVMPAHIGGTVRIGDVVTRRPVTFDTKDGPLVRGRVVYIHPKSRFHVVEFGEGATAVRESFMGVQR